MNPAGGEHRWTSGWMMSAESTYSLPPAKNEHLRLDTHLEDNQNRRDIYSIKIQSKVCPECPVYCRVEGTLQFQVSPQVGMQQLADVTKRLSALRNVMI